jgi:hypothetical protein
MATPSDIFARQRLTTGQMRAVAERRFDDAKALCETGQNARANGAQYLAGIVIEILLKTALVKQFSGIAIKRSHEVLDHERKVWNLIWRSHDLAEMLDQLPILQGAVELKGQRAGKPYTEWLVDICGRWTIFARYTSVTSTMDEAQKMLERVRELKEVL